MNPLIPYSKPHSPVFKFPLHLQVDQVLREHGISASQHYLLKDVKTDKVYHMKWFLYWVSVDGVPRTTISSEMQLLEQELYSIIRDNKDTIQKRCPSILIPYVIAQDVRYNELLSLMMRSMTRKEAQLLIRQGLENIFSRVYPSIVLRYNNYPNIGNRMLGYQELDVNISNMIHTFRFGATISPQIRSVSIWSLSDNEYLDVIILITHAIKFMNEELRISHNDLHLGNVLVERRNICLKVGDNYIKCSVNPVIMDFDLATSDSIQQPHPFHPALKTVNSSGKRDLLIFICNMVKWSNISPSMVERIGKIIFKSNVEGNKLKRNIMTTENCMTDNTDKLFIDGHNTENGIRSLKDIVLACTNMKKSFKKPIRGCSLYYTD